MSYIYLSYMLQEGSPVHIGLKEPHMVHNNKISSAGYNTYMITVENHSGTHVDAPGHFLKQGKTIEEYNLEDLIFDRILLWDYPLDPEEQVTKESFYELENDLNLTNNDLKGLECLLIRTGFSKYRKDNLEKYLTANPGISPDFIDCVRENFPNVRVLGIDCISISTYGQPETAIEAHQTAFRDDKKYGEPLLLIEDMKLQNVPSEELIDKLFIVPWQIKGIDSAPCSIIAQLKE